MTLLKTKHQQMVEVRPGDRLIDISTSPYRPVVLRVDDQRAAPLTVGEAETLGAWLIHHAQALRAAGLGLALLLTLGACASEGTTTPDEPDASSVIRGLAGHTGTGGQVATGGSSVVASGGRVATGGTTASGGTSSQGGQVGTGGATTSPDAGTSPDLTPAPDLRPSYVNDAGWSPDPTTQGACCLPCGDYTGCLTLVQTTPYCTVTVGGSCYQGGTGSTSVWPQCRPVKASGGCR